MANTNKSLTTNIIAGSSILKDSSKMLSSTTKLDVSIKKDPGKQLVSISKVGTSIFRGINKRMVSISKAIPVFNKRIDKNINTVIKLVVTKEINDASITLAYNGNAELGLGSQEGSRFNIIVTGTFSTFTIAMNGKTLTYTENCVAQTITIDNVNATVKNGATNKLSKVTGDVADFLKLIPGDNRIAISKTGGNIDFKFDFRSQFI